MENDLKEIIALAEMRSVNPEKYKEIIASIKAVYKDLMDICVETGVAAHEEIAGTGEEEEVKEVEEAGHEEKSQGIN